ncbi:acyl-coenzyme A thioesterase PaaI-like protein [Jatrophihabitans sp. GAS493]|uniref:PaaI family thioesterase n=1 Tax=Jatrophihabitans sp. GAS493 TaxID=1907575 RepID=UPI000BB722C4|nr:PaaI family thioesterase [Jatrophihabitans sp. GAS493]SOD72283.1 acyl-coenzyme A thioesterase PaaI-like protein [Jatrophihabitans sp. GAS493]
MDATRLARDLLESIPANHLFGLRVLRAADGVGEVGVNVSPRSLNVIGALHSSGLVALIDAAGLAAVISVSPDDQQFDNIVPLGSVARLEFLAPACGRLLARCTLSHNDRASLSALYRRDASRVRLTTTAEVTDANGVTVCRGSFTWHIRRVAEPPRRQLSQLV